jgi:hypothetical protein
MRSNYSRKKASGGTNFNNLQSLPLCQKRIVCLGTIPPFMFFFSFLLTMIFFFDSKM